MKAANLEEIATIAYYLWEAAGRPNGRSLEYWLKAEAQLRAAQDVVEAVTTATPKQPAGKTGDKGVRYGLILKSARGRSALFSRSKG